MTVRLSRILLRGVVCLGASLAPRAHAIELKVSPEALERTLRAQLFRSPDGRYYLRGDAHSACSVYAEKPIVSFHDERIFVHVHAHGRLGQPLRGACVGVGLNTEADVSFVPEAEGETIGFRDARIEGLSESRELNFLLVPFLSRKLPSEMKVNAADLLRKLLQPSEQAIGYAIALDTLRLHSMQVEQGALLVDADAALEIR